MIPMTGFIPELTTRVTVTIKTDELDSAIGVAESDMILSACGYSDELNQLKSELLGLQDPLASAVAERLQSNQEMIISSKHYLTGMMANSVDITHDGPDYLVGNTATSVDGFPYPLAIETGRREVFPVNRKWLRWFEGGIGGKPVFAKHSSAVSADPFVEPSIQNTAWDIDEIVEDFLNGL